jgi:hypothetical protein
MNIAANERKSTRIETIELLDDLTHADLRSFAFIRGQSSPRLRVSVVR